MWEGGLIGCLNQIKISGEQIESMYQSPHDMYSSVNSAIPVLRVDHKEIILDVSKKHCPRMFMAMLLIKKNQLI